MHFGNRDFRIKDGDAKEIPYVIKTLERQSPHSFEEFAIEEKKVRADKKMHVVIKTPATFLNQLNIEVQNTDASRTVNINGSNDNKQWFVIKENVAVISEENNAIGTYQISIPLPVVKYAYLDIAFNDKDLLPVNIIKAGIFHSSISSGLFDTVAPLSIIQKDSNKISYITIKYAESYPIESIILQIEGAKYFKREVQYWANETGGGFQSIQSSDSVHLIPVNSKANNFRFIISNNDNQPLQINLHWQ